VSTHELAFALAYFGALLGVVMVVPQILRTIRHPHLTGVAPMAWAFTALACLLWLVFGIRTATFPQIPGNILLVSGAVAIVLLVPSHVSRVKRALMLGSAAGVLVFIAYQIPPHTIGYFAFAIGLYSMWPQLYTSVWVNRGGGASGLSISTWTLKVVSQSCWFAYAFLLLDFPVIISATFGITTTLVVLGVETSRRRRDTKGIVRTHHLVLEPA
jgi:uncharacterized protein with PQ loop repeat